MRDRNNLFGVPFGNEEAATETPFFQRADMMDTKVGTMKKDDPADIAKDGFEGWVICGLKNKAGTLQNLPRQERRLHQSRDETLTVALIYEV
ncbi:MAG: hypothetical protein WB697_00360 [Stellaceae bacterium]